MEDKLQDANDNKLIVVQQIQDALNRLIIRAQEEMLEYGTFAPISEGFVNTNHLLYCRNIYLTISHPSSFIENYKTKRYFELIVKTPSNLSSASCVMVAGNKAEILSQITAEGISEKLRVKLIEMANELETDHFG